MIKNRFCGWFLLIILFPTPLPAQSDKAPPVSKVFATLSKSLESKRSVVGDEVVLRTISDVVVDGQVVIPKGSKLTGCVAGVATKGKDEPKSLLAIIIDKAVPVDGGEMSLQAIIVAVAAPPNALSSDPTYGMMHSNEPKMIGVTPGTTANSGSLTAGSKAGSTAAVATAQINGSMEALLLNEDSQGAVGYEGISVSWSLTMPPPLTIFTSKAKNVKLDAGTQVLLRMAPPRLAK